MPDTDRLVERLEALGAFARDFDWRMHDLVVAPVSRIDGVTGDGARACRGAAGG